MGFVMFRSRLKRWFFRLSFTRFTNILIQAHYRRGMRILDVGCGNNSAVKTKVAFPDCEYHGIDCCNYNNAEGAMAAIDKFYLMDLTNLDFRCIPDAYFDVVVMSHVIEHLKNGDEVIKALIPKLKPGGVIYIEYPAPRTAEYPKQARHLNFYDDPTHVRVFCRRELREILENEHLKIIKAKTRKNLIRILLTPLLLLYSRFIRDGYFSGTVLIDITGFAEYIVARRPLMMEGAN